MQFIQLHDLPYQFVFKFWKCTCAFMSLCTVFQRPSYNIESLLDFIVLYIIHYKILSLQKSYMASVKLKVLCKYCGPMLIVMYKLYIHVDRIIILKPVYLYCITLSLWWWLTSSMCYYWDNPRQHNHEPISSHLQRHPVVLVGCTPSCDLVVQHLVIQESAAVIESRDCGDPLIQQHRDHMALSKALVLHGDVWWWSFNRHLWLQKASTNRSTCCIHVT